MPLTRYQIRNEYSLADPELYKAADRDDPEELLEGVAMAGLVGVLRQLGDLAEFAAEIFHDLHEQVMVTAARGHGLMARVQQLEAEVPSIEKAFLSQTNHSSFFSNAGVDWHPNLRMEQNLITQGDLPRCVMDSYEECRGPPRLFLLDKFDVAGAGACLKRYTDPSLFKVESAPNEIPSIEVQREKKIRKVKKKGSRWRNGETPEIVPTSHAKLHQLFLEEKIEKGESDPARLVKLKKRQLNASPFDSRSGKSYMEKFLETTPEHNIVHEISVTPLPLKMTPHNSSESGLEIHDISTVSPEKKSSQGKEISCASPDAHEEVLKPSTDDLYGEVIDRQIVKVPESSADGKRDYSPYILHEATAEKEIVVDEEDKQDGSMDGDNSDDRISEVDNYMDALATMESEMETDNEYRPKIESGFSNLGKCRRDSYGNGKQLEFQAHSSDSQSIGNFSASDDGNSSFKKGRSSFSYSDTLSNLAENTQSDGEGSTKVFPSEDSVPEIKETTSNQLPTYAEVLSTTHELTMQTDICIDEDNMCDRGDASGNYFDIDSNAHLLPLEPAESSLQQKLDETPSETMKTDSELSDIDERQTNFADPSAVVFDMSSQIRDITLSTACAESCPLDKLGGGAPNVSSDTLLHFSNNLKLVPEQKSSDDSSVEVLPKDCAEENSPENIVNIKIGLPKSISSPREEQSAFSALPEVDVCSGFTLLPNSSDVGKLDDVVSKVDDPFLESSTSVMDTSLRCSFKEQQASDVVDNETAENLVHCSEEANPADTSGHADGEKIGVSTYRVEAVEGDAAPLQLPSNCACSLKLEDHSGLDDMVAESVQAENMALSSIVTDNVLPEACADDCVDNVVCLQEIIFSPSNDLVNFQEFPSGTEDPDDGLESNELVSPECLRQLEAEKEMTQLDVAPKDFESASSKLVSYEDSNLEMVNGVHNLSLADTTENSLPADGIPILPASLELCNQGMESKHLHESCLMDDGEDSKSSPAGHLSNPDTSLEQSLEVQADQLDVDSMTGEASSYSPTCLSKQVQSSNNGNQERLFNVESCQEDLSSKPLLSECLRQSTGQEINNAKQEMDLLCPGLPGFVLLHEATQINLEEMPPLPPLPPMQWIAPLISQREFIDHSQESFPSRLPFGGHEKAQSGFPSNQSGFLPSFNPFLTVSAVEVKKLQHVPEQEEGNAMLPTLSALQLPSMANDANSQNNNLVVEETQSLHPLLTLSASPKEKHEHSLLASECEVVRSSSNPFLSLPSVKDTTSGSDSVSSPEILDHPLSQLLSEPGLEDKTFQQAPENSEGEHVNPTDTSVLPPQNVEEQPQLDFLSSEGKTLQHTPENSESEHLNPSVTPVLPPQKVEEQPQHGFLSSEGELAWPSNPFALLPTFEVGKQNGNSIVKFPRPRNPLIDAVAAHDKSKLRKVSERVRPEIEPKVDERDSLLEQIRTKSFNLKPAVVSRPSIQGPKTNLRVAAILEKANAIRQATAGSDEDDDDDSWSDS